MQEILQEFKNKEKILKIVLSDTKNNEFKKIIFRPIQNNKNSIIWQLEKYKNNQVFHENITENDLLEKFKNLYLNYRQIAFNYEGQTVTYAFKNNKYKKSISQNNLTNKILSHNRQKQYILNEGEHIPALIDLGIFNSNFEIIKSKYDKFKQINRFIEIIDDAFKQTNKTELTILDFGCGKSYLTFILYYYCVLLLFFY